MIEYNARMGDPETEAVIPRIKSDLLELLIAAAGQKLDKVEIEDRSTLCRSSDAGISGYPGDYEKNKEIYGLDKVKDGIVFHAGTTLRPGDRKVVSSGGRVIAVTSMGATLEEAFRQSYENAEKITI